jgi:tRNA threonylcarbamoyl adenosine modification protein (Sua5/YciO/YrdC/YwlC family)
MVVTIMPDNIDRRKIDQAIECLNNDGLLIFPTDTVYSIGCSLNSPKALEKLARLKGVKLEKANFSLLCEDLSHLSDFSKQVTNSVFKLMKQVLPGPFTFILEAGRNVPKVFSSRKKTIGIRVPDNNIAQALIRALGCPLVATSVHDDDEVLEYTADPERIAELWEHAVDLLIDGGPGGLEPSTVLDCTGTLVQLIRQGKGVLQ